MHAGFMGKAVSMEPETSPAFGVQPLDPLCLFLVQLCHMLLRK